MAYIISPKKLLACFSLCLPLYTLLQVILLSANCLIICSYTFLFIIILYSSSGINCLPCCFSLYRIRLEMKHDWMLWHSLDAISWGHGQYIFVNYTKCKSLSSSRRQCIFENYTKCKSFSWPVTSQLMIIFYNLLFSV